MFYYLEEDHQKHVSIYKEALKHERLMLGLHYFDIETLTSDQVFHPIFQLIFLDVLRVHRHIKFSEIRFSIRVDPEQLFGISNSLEISCDSLSDDFIRSCMSDEMFLDAIKSHSLWFRFQSFLDLSFDGDKASLYGLSLLMRHLFWQKKLATDYVLSSENKDSFLTLIKEIVKLFSSKNETIELTNSLISNSDFRHVEGIDGVVDLGDGIAQTLPNVKNEDEMSVTKDVVADDDDFDFEVIAKGAEAFNLSIKNKISTSTFTRRPNEIHLSLRNKNYKDFVSKLVLVTFGRVMGQGDYDLKTNADDIFKNIEIYTFDILAAAFACPYVAEIWASNLKKTASSLVFLDVIYDLFDQMSYRLSTRTYDHPKRGNTIHCFRHLSEYEEGIHKKFVEFVKVEQWPMPINMGERNFAELLWELLKNKTDCKYSSYFFEVNQPQTLSEIKHSCATLDDFLNLKVKGQPEALRQIVNAEMWSRFKSSKGLRGLFTFLGPSGVGKTHLAKTYAEALNLTDKTGYKIQLFNMENYSDERAASALIGSGSQYTDASAGELTFHVHLYPRTVLVFDEIEKAHPTVIQTLLTLIDTGRLTDATSRVEVDFSQCVIIFTSNLGHEIFDKAKDLGALDVFDVLKKAKLRNSDRVALSPEFVNRLGAGAAVRFLPLNTKSLLDIAKMQVQSLDLDDDGLIDYTLDHDLAAILLFSQLPQPTVRGLKAKQINLIAEAKQLLFSMPELDSALDKLSKLRINVDPNCFQIAQYDGRVLIVGELGDFASIVKTEFAGYELVEIAPFNPDFRLVSTSKISAILIVDKFQEEDILKQQMSYCQEHFSEIPVFLISEVVRQGRYLEAVWIKCLLCHTEMHLPQMKLLLDVHRRLQLAKQKQQGFSYQLELSDVSSDGVTFSVTDPKFNLQISTARAEEGVTGLLKERPEIRLHQVIGLQRAKTHLQRVIKWLKQPDLLASQNIAFPAGMLLAGPPGTGKTLLAKAVAGECELPFISLSVGDLISGVKNGTAENIDRAFKQAADVAPCIMFIDEIDTVATARRAGEISDNNAVNVLLTHLDGIQKRAEPIFVLAATNFPQVLDPALLRAGRLDEIIYCDLPDKAARQDFFVQLSAKYSIVIDEEEQAKYVEMTQGMSGAQLDKIFRDYLYRVSAEDFCQHANRSSPFHHSLFREAIINIRYGSANPDKALSAESKVQVAWHEAGHLLMTKLLLPQHAITFATIEPRNQSLGFVSIQRDDAVGSSTASEVRAQIAVAMAGREAERLQNDNYDVTAGAVSDIEVATRYAMHAVCEWGLDPEFGQLSASVLNYQTTSADLQKLAEQRIRFWLEEGQQKAAQILLENKKLLQEIARQLLEKESLYADEIETFFK